MDDLFLLSESQMARISPHFPLAHGVPRVDQHRRTAVVELVNEANDHMITIYIRIREGHAINKLGRPDIVLVALLQDDKAVNGPGSVLRLAAPPSHLDPMVVGSQIKALPFVFQVEGEDSARPFWPKPLP